MKAGHAIPVKQIFLIGAMVLLLTTWFSEGFNHFDEHCQIMEFAGFKLGLTDKASLPWEYDCQMRPAFQPLVVCAVYQAISPTGITDPFIIAFITRLIAAGVSFLSILMIFKAYRETFSNRNLQYAFLMISFFLWFLMYNNVRFSSETMSGRVFIIGFVWFMMKKCPAPADYFLTGILIGISFLLRYQVALMILGFGAWLLFIHKAGFRNLISFSLGIGMMILLGILLDRWFYGSWALTTWNYFRQNIILDKASGFGVYPWWYYFEQTFMNAIPPFSLVYIFAVFIYVFYRRKDPITWTILPFLLFHFIVPHKEIRFLFPILGFLPVMIIRSGEILLTRHGYDLLDKRTVRLTIKAFWYTNLVMAAILIFRPADDQIALYRKIYYNYQSPVKLYFTGENPYRRASVNLNFYKRSNMTYQKIESVQDIIPSNKEVNLLVTNAADIRADSLFKPTLIYASFPMWVKHFNVNHWIERTNFWYVYELQPTKKPV